MTERRRTRARRLGLPLLLGAVAVGGCNFTPTYQRPTIPVPSEWPASATLPAGAQPTAPGASTSAPGTSTSVPGTSTSAPGTSTSAPGTSPSPPESASDLGWRDVFTEPRMQTLVALALENNRDLRVAALNVELARAMYQIQRAALLPQVGASASVTRERVPADQSVTGQAVTGTMWTTSVGITAYELDLFGRIRSLKEQMLERFFATEEAQKSARLTLVAEVASQYLALRALDEQVALAVDTLQLVEASLELTRNKYSAGLASELDFRTAEAQRETARINLAAYRLQRDQAIHALVVLLGRPMPAELPPPAEPTGTVIAELSPSVPSELLERRPDILAAEHLLKAANANIGAARAAFFPSITLTATGGFSSLELARLFDGPSGMWQFAPQLNVPIFTGGRTQANLDASNVQKSIEIAHYEKAIQTAFREVADALAARAQLNAQLEAQSARVTSDERRYELSKMRYEKGVDSYLTVLTAQQDLYAAQQVLIQGRLARATNLVSLYKALGGGWRDRSHAARETDGSKGTGQNGRTERAGPDHR